MTAMDEYVTKEQVINWFKPYRYFKISFDTLVGDLRVMKAADAVPVRHGLWIEYQIPPVICCSNCDWATDVKEKNFNYCPNCGAKMDLEDLNDD